MATTKRNPSRSPDNPIIEFEEIELKGEKYSLAYSFLAIAKAERLVGRNLLSGFGQMMVSVSEFKDQAPWEISASDLLGLFFAALLPAHPDMTLERAAALVDGESLNEIWQAIGRAYQKSMPKKKPSPMEPGAAGEGEES